MVQLSRLERVDLTEVWPNEAHDFTPWLADNIELLAEILGLDLEVRAQEAEVGSFSLDLLAHDLGSDRPVVIENQIKPTNHDHLGKLLTYAAGYDAHVVVWLAQDFRAEHKAAIDWLNRRTGEDTAFFGVSVEAWRIGESSPAPHFSAVAVPNDWQKRVATAQQASATDQASERGTRYRIFFQELIDTMRVEHNFTRARKGQPQNWYHFATGFPGFAYNVSFAWEGFVRVGLYIDSGDKSLNESRFDRLLDHRSGLESAMSCEPVWKRREE
ncbi:MAG: DUF4268 domain-containing protein, partial [Chloroflexi bacterium]|nr:DUF4268 domain-containing protein [Chloroflexota bacterium]